MSNIVIKAENISKYYNLGQINNGTFFRDLQSWIAIKSGREDPNSKLNEKAQQGEGFWALKDINFEIKQGDRVGIIGKNGAGKSTLLKLISEITSPTTGNIYIKGRVASLLEVGTGFHREMTGRENIYLNGAILGMKRSEINAKMNDIIEFSEIGEHIDTPVKRYSSGMYVRLAFAVAANLDSDILIADEVLAVGDAEFQKKALGKMNEISSGEGKTVLFVSHQMNAVKALCETGLLLDKGKIVTTGPINECISCYQNSFYSDKLEIDLSEYNNEFMNLIDFKILDKNGENAPGIISNDDNHFVEISFFMKKMHTAFTIGYAVYDSFGTLVYWSNSVDIYDPNKNTHIGRNTIRGTIPAHFLNEGEYEFRLMCGIHFQQWLINPDEKAPSKRLVIRGGLSDSPFWTLKRPGICAPVLEWQQVE